MIITESMGMIIKCPLIFDAGQTAQVFRHHYLKHGLKVNGAWTPIPRDNQQSHIGVLKTNLRCQV